MATIWSIVMAIHLSRSSGLISIGWVRHFSRRLYVWMTGFAFKKKMQRVDRFFLMVLGLQDSMRMFHLVHLILLKPESWRPLLPQLSWDLVECMQRLYDFK
jgi:hypothetical protein